MDSSRAAFTDKETEALVELKNFDQVHMGAGGGNTEPCGHMVTESLNNRKQGYE